MYLTGQYHLTAITTAVSQFHSSQASSETHYLDLSELCVEVNITVIDLLSSRLFSVTSLRNWSGSSLNSVLFQITMIPNYNYSHRLDPTLMSDIGKIKIFNVNVTKPYS